MKKIILGAMLSLSIGATTMAITSKPTIATCQYGRCSAYKDDGTRCRNCAQEGSNYCWSHNHQ